MAPRPVADGARDLEIVERDQAIDELVAHASDAARGLGRLVLVSGEAGIGKSSLVEQLRRRRSDAKWLEGACDGLFTPRPLGPLLDMADQLDERLVQRVRTGSDRDTVFSDFLTHLSEGDRLCVVVIEDLHWADETTLDLVRYLGRRIRDTPTLLVVTYRSEALGAHERLRVVVGDLGRQQSARRIELRPLSREGVAQLCRGADGNDRDPSRLHLLTGGNPFFLTEVLRLDGTEVPGSVRDAVLARLAPLSDDARTTLETAALLGMRFSPSTLAHATDVEPAGIDELLDHGLLLEEGSCLRFRHELARLAVEESLPAHRQAPLHRRILDILLDLKDTDEARLAFHAEGCVDQEAVLDLAPRAARVAARMGSTGKAVTQYRRALRFAENADVATRAELFDGLADAHALLDEYQSATGARDEAIALWFELGDVRREADSLRRHMWTLSSSNRPKEALESCERAVELLTPLGTSAELAWALSALGRIHMVQGRYASSLRWAREAQARAVELGIDDVMSDALNTEACSKACLRMPWQHTLTRSLELAEAIPDPSLVARASYNTFCNLYRELRLAEADAWFRKTAGHPDEQQFDTFYRCLRREHARMLVDMGRWDEALARARLQSDELDEAPQQRILPRLVVALVTSRRGEDDNMREILDGALRLAGETGQPQYVVPVRLARAEIRWLHGDQEAAWNEIELARDLQAEDYALARAVELWAHRTGLGGSVDEQDEAMSLELSGRWTAAARSWDQLSCPYDAALALLGSDDAIHLREAVVRFDALGAVIPAGLARQKMREHGYDSIPSGRRATTRAHPKGLTQREQEVLDLVVSGLRNRDIAEQLFLSAKTVAVHVSSIIRKLEVSSRTEAAAWVHRENDAHPG